MALLAPQASAGRALFALLRWRRFDGHPTYACQLLIWLGLLFLGLVSGVPSWTGKPLRWGRVGLLEAELRPVYVLWRELVVILHRSKNPEASLPIGQVAHLGIAESKLEHQPIVFIGADYPRASDHPRLSRAAIVSLHSLLDPETGDRKRPNRRGVAGVLQLHGDPKPMSCREALILVPTRKPFERHRYGPFGREHDPRTVAGMEILPRKVVALAHQRQLIHNHGKSTYRQDGRDALGDESKRAESEFPGPGRPLSPWPLVLLLLVCLLLALGGSYLASGAFMAGRYFAFAVTLFCCGALIAGIVVLWVAHG